MKENEKVEAEKEPEPVSGTRYGDYETGKTSSRTTWKRQED